MVFDDVAVGLDAMPDDRRLDIAREQADGEVILDMLLPPFVSDVVRR